MTKKFSKKHLAIAIGTAVAASFSFTPVVNAEQNPFGMTDLSNGYVELAEGEKKADGSCGEGKCGGQMKMDMEKKAEGSCGEGKCGEGKCAGNKKKDSIDGNSGDKTTEADE
ncbi:MAG: HvfA family oxazolone/thioamide-modified RiPP metallophore [Methylococcales bacterium]